MTYIIISLKSTRVDKDVMPLFILSIPTFTLKYVPYFFFHSRQMQVDLRERYIYKSKSTKI